MAETLFLTQGDEASTPSIPSFGGSLAAARDAARDALSLTYDDPDQPLLTAPARVSNWKTQIGDRDVVRTEARARVTAARLKADKALKGEDWQGCEQALGEALKLDTNNPGLYLSRAYVRLKQDSTTRSLQDSGKAISLDPRSPRGYHRYARTLCQEKRFSEAGASFVQGLGLDPSFKSQGRCDVVLEAIRRERHYYPGPKKSARDTQRVLASTPPPSATPPVAPAAPLLVSSGVSSLSLRWADTEDDGGDEPYEYTLEMATIDLGTVAAEDAAADADADAEWQATLEWRVAWSGLGQSKLTVDALAGETGFAFRLGCVNAIGNSPWSVALRCATVSAAAEETDGETELPPGWTSLRSRLSDVLALQLERHAVSEEKNWQALARSLSAHQAPLKMAFRLYTLLGEEEEEEEAEAAGAGAGAGAGAEVPAEGQSSEGISEALFLRFVKDAHVKPPQWLPRDDATIFQLALREAAPPTELPSPDEAAAPVGAAGAVGAEQDGVLGLVQWVAAFVRLAVLRYLEKPAPADPPTPTKGSVAEAVELLLERHVIPFATFEVSDELSLVLTAHCFLLLTTDYLPLTIYYSLLTTFQVRDELSLVLKSKAVRPVVAKYREELNDIFLIFCRADKVLAAGAADAAANGTMNLP